MIVRVRPFSLGCVRRRYMRRHGTRFNRHWHSLGFGESQLVKRRNVPTRNSNLIMIKR